MIVTLARLFCPAGVRTVVAESLLFKHQILISTRWRPTRGQVSHIALRLEAIAYLVIHAYK
jgi:hypothetical protein